MTAIELLQTLKQKGIRLQPAGERLRYFPSSAVTPELKEALAAHKAELISILRQPAAEQLHFALKDQAVLGEPIMEKCLVDGCNEKIKFYYFDGVGYGYCRHCDIHQRIEIRIV